MIPIQLGSVPFPPNANSDPIRELAQALQGFSQSMQNGSKQITGTANKAASSWVGIAVEAFKQHLGEQSKAADSAAESFSSAAPILNTFAAALDQSVMIYNVGSGLEKNPWTAAAGIAMEATALGMLQAAGGACAAGLFAIEAKLAATLFKGVDRSKHEPPKAAVKSEWEELTKSAYDFQPDQAGNAKADAERELAARQAQDRYVEAVNGIIAEGWTPGEASKPITDIGVDPGAKYQDYLADWFAKHYGDGDVGDGDGASGEAVAVLRPGISYGVDTDSDGSPDYWVNVGGPPAASHDSPFGTPVTGGDGAVYETYGSDQSGYGSSEFDTSKFSASSSAPDAPGMSEQFGDSLGDLAEWWDGLHDARATPAPSKG